MIKQYQWLDMFNKIKLIILRDINFQKYLEMNNNVTIRKAYL